MKVGAVIQARMSSQRLPGKMLRQLKGRPLIGHVAEILLRCDVDELVIATSTEATDDPLEHFCRLGGWTIYRGDLENVADRFRRVLESRDWDVMIRVSGDSPLLDYRLVNKVADLACNPGVDVATNVFPRTFPRGQSVEAIRREAFFSGYRMITTPAQREHVTPVFYENARRFRIRNLTAPRTYNHAHLAVDSLADYRAVARTFEAMGRPVWNYTLDQIVDLHLQRQQERKAA